MKDNKIQKGIEEIRNIKMTATEKKQVFNNILNYSETQAEPVRSEWANYSFFARIRSSRLVYAIAIFLLIIGTSGGVVSASEDSLPDSFLYPLKVDVIEPVRGAFITNPEEKAQYESNLATTRLVEAETLAKIGKLDIKKEEKLNKLLTSHTDALNKALSKIDKKNSNDKVDEIVVNFQAGMKAHARVLESISKDGENEVNNKKDNEVSQIARLNADKVKVNLGEKEQNIEDKYKKKKEKVQNMIDSKINKRPAIAITAVSNSNIVEEDKIDTETDKAKHFLNEAEKKEKEGDQIQAYGELINSESSMIEEEIFTNAQLNLKQKENKQKTKDEKVNIKKKWNN